MRPDMEPTPGMAPERAPDREPLDRGAQSEPGHGPHAKLVRMANQIATFFETKPHAMGVAGVAEHINKFWEPRMRGKLFELMESGDVGLRPLVLEAAPAIRRPGAPLSPVQAYQASAGAPEGKGQAAGETKSRIAASQG